MTLVVSEEDIGVGGLTKGEETSVACNGYLDALGLDCDRVLHGETVETGYSEEHLDQVAETGVQGLLVDLGQLHVVVLQRDYASLESELVLDFVVTEHTVRPVEQLVLSQSSLSQ